MGNKMNTNLIKIKASDCSIINPINEKYDLVLDSNKYKWMLKNTEFMTVSFKLCFNHSINNESLHEDYDILDNIRYHIVINGLNIFSGYTNNIKNIYPTTKSIPFSLLLDGGFIIYFELGATIDNLSNVDISIEHIISNNGINQEKLSNIPFGDGNLIFENNKISHTKYKKSDLSIINNVVPIDNIIKPKIFDSSCYYSNDVIVSYMVYNRIDYVGEYVCYKGIIKDNKLSVPWFVWNIYDYLCDMNVEITIDNKNIIRCLGKTMLLEYDLPKKMTDFIITDLDDSYNGSSCLFNFIGYVSNMDYRRKYKTHK